KVRWFATSRIEASSGIDSKRSRPRTTRRRRMSSPKIGSRIHRCHSAPSRAPPPTFAQRITRKASRSNGASASNGGAPAERSRPSAGSSATASFYLDPAWTSEPRHQLGDDLLHDLAGAAADAEQARVAERARYRRLDHVTHAAVELHAVVYDPLDEIPGEQLRHADLLHRRLLASEQVAGPVGEPARRLDRGEVIGEAVPPHLELDERLVERLALVAVAERLGDHLIHAGDGADGRHQPLALEVRHHVVEALVLLAEQVADRDPAVLEEEQRGVAREIADLLQLLGDGESLHVGGEGHE